MPYYGKKPNLPKENDWPQNLIDAIGFEWDDPLEHLSDDGEMALAMCLCHLTEREKKVLWYRYFGQHDLVETGKLFGVTRERIRQVEAKALRKMRHPSDAGGYILRNGVKAYIDKLVEEKVSRILLFRREELENEYRHKRLELEIGKEKANKIFDADKVLAMEIEDLDLSVRPYNCVKRVYCDTVGELVKKYPTFEDAMQIRNLGRKSLEEISKRLKELGIIWPAYGENEDR